MALIVSLSLHGCSGAEAGGTSPTTPGGGSAAVTWTFDASGWRSSGAPPTCPTPLLGAPVNLTQATSVLYPGQVRGGDYKSHGGLRFDRPGQTNAVAVVAAMDATVYRGVRYIEADTIQYLFDFINRCGVMIRLDHLLTLSPRFAAIAAQLPTATTSSATTMITGQTVTIGETIATAIGVPRNVSFDFGVYDLRQRNPATTTRTGELIPYGICWLDQFSSANNALVRALPPGDGAMGATSDYCR